jgi:hypothetical protein
VTNFGSVRPAGLVGPLLLEGQQVLLQHLVKDSLLRLPARRFAQGMSVCLRFALEQPPRPWPEQVLPSRRQGGR